MAIGHLICDCKVTHFLPNSQVFLLFLHLFLNTQRTQRNYNAESEEMFGSTSKIVFSTVQVEFSTPKVYRKKNLGTTGGTQTFLSLVVNDTSHSCESSFILQWELSKLWP